MPSPAPRLVTTEEVTPEGLALWLDLPEELRNDGDLAAFRTAHEMTESNKNTKARTREGPDTLPYIDGDLDELDLDGEARPLRRGECIEMIPSRSRPDCDIYTETKLGSTVRKKDSLFERALQYTKITFLMACWGFFTTVLILYSEKELVERHTSLHAGEIKSYEISTKAEDLRVWVNLDGPFWSEQLQRKYKSNLTSEDSVMEVWLERQPTEKDNDTHMSAIDAEKSKPWLISLLEINEIDFSQGEPRSKVLQIHEKPPILGNSAKEHKYTIKMRHNSNVTVPFTVTYTKNPLDTKTGIIYAAILLIGLYVIIIFDLINRTLAAIITSTTALAVLALVGERPTMLEIISWMDTETLLLLFSMMLLVTLIAETGFFDYLARKAFEKTKGETWPLINLLYLLTIVVSLFLDNVTTVLLLTPATIRLCEVTNINPVPILMELRHQVSAWKKALSSLTNYRTEEKVVRRVVENKLQILEQEIKEQNKCQNLALPKETFEKTLEELREKYTIKDKTLLIQTLAAITFIVIVFFLHSLPQMQSLSLGWSALLGTTMLLVLADKDDLQPILSKVEWSTLLFFAALFIFMEAITKLGLIQWIGGLTEELILTVDEKYQLPVAILLVLWVSGITSAFVDNIPLTSMMVRVVTSLGTNPNLALPMAPLIWALSFGACMGGNGTLVGASANVICAGLAEQHNYKFTFKEFFRIGAPMTIGHLVTVSAYLLICHCVFTWH
ncbi:hypothetical protein JYU34_021968 [Plutella xylostella]|uniref:Citrate transporter-like domain-containing protein n=1 Tax=Plutella xylostella TaxID=51655 RepID=A0ABQ7PS17_PLUXY|nr:hypothetical protein JYU34_021968 [Plutella xylostella]